MASQIFSIVVFLMSAQCGLVFSAAGTRPGAQQDGDHPPIQLSEMLTEFRRIHHDNVDVHLSFMMLAASYGDRLYQLPVEVSTDCRRTAAANSALLAQLALCEDAFDAMFSAVDSTTRDLRKRAQLLEHPLEVVCRNVEKEYAQRSTLSAAFEKAKKEALVVDSATAPYFDKLIPSKELFGKLVEKSDDPRLAKLLALASFRNLLRGSPGLTKRSMFFARACRDMAKEERFARSMQQIFEKAIGDVVTDIGAADRMQKFKSAFDSEPRSGGFWWMQSMADKFRDHVAQDAILKKEADDRAATMV